MKKIIYSLLFVITAICAACDEDLPKANFDFVNECHWLPTQGDIKWVKLMNDLEETGYKGVFMYEATKDHENNNMRPAPERVVETFNKIIKSYKIQK